MGARAGGPDGPCSRFGQKLSLRTVCTIAGPMMISSIAGRMMRFDKPARLTVTVLAVGMLTAHAFLPFWMAQRAVVSSRRAVLCVDHRIGRGGRCGAVVRFAARNSADVRRAAANVLFLTIVRRAAALDVMLPDVTSAHTHCSVSLLGHARIGRHISVRAISRHRAPVRRPQALRHYRAAPSIRPPTCDRDGARRCRRSSGRCANAHAEVITPIPFTAAGA